MKRLILLLPLCLASALATAADEFDLYLVRHAEKAANDGRDPNLTPAGEQRAQRLADWLATRDIEAAWSTDYRRTRQTVLPLATARGLEVHVYAPGEPDTTAAELLSAGQNTLVAGHSNTIPALAEALCDCPVEPMDELEYDRLYHLRVVGDTVSLDLLDQSEILQTATPAH